MPKWIPEIVKILELFAITKGLTRTLLIGNFAVVCSKAIAWARITASLTITRLILKKCISNWDSTVWTAPRRQRLSELLVNTSLISVLFASQLSAVSVT